mmetsp:Transcript_33296/g.63934  ORF Transcript_33296/g.63934 Transcript_33296/m.63934 type:complete len:88 (+) Transcript_33296:11-274(+)
MSKQMRLYCNPNIEDMIDIVTRIAMKVLFSSRHGTRGKSHRLAEKVVTTLVQGFPKIFSSHPTFKFIARHLHALQHVKIWGIFHSRL